MVTHFDVEGHPWGGVPEAADLVGQDAINESLTADQFDMSALNAGKFFDSGF